jgi:hypothetical protein
VITAAPACEWVFFINVPLGVAVGIALVRVLPAVPATRDGTGLDVIGAVLVTTATGVLIDAFIHAGDIGWGAGETVGMLVAGVLLYGVLAIWLRVARNPLVPPALVERRPVVAGTFVLFVATALLVSMFFLGTFYLQDVRGHGPLQTGLMFLPLAVATMAGAHTGERLLAGVGGRAVAVTGLLVTAVCLVVASGFDATAAKVSAASVASLGLGALFVVASVTALSSVASQHAGTASGFLSTFHEMGAASGAAVMSGVVGAGLATDSLASIDRGYLVAAAVAAASALVAVMIIPGRSQDSTLDGPVMPSDATPDTAPKRRSGNGFALH